MADALTLDWRTKQAVRYAVPLWLRDEQIAQAIKRVKGRVQPHERRAQACAVVGFGPSLSETWEQVRDFQHVFSCSGSHRYLLERDIVPTWHVEVDPRPHKVGLLGAPDSRVTYLPASTCSPAYFDHLEAGLGREAFDRQVLLWHVFDPSEDGRRLLPHGEWAVMGGCDVGLRALALAAFLGFREIHVFGLDGNARGESRHAAEHPNGKLPQYAEVEYGGKKYFTTAGMLEAARQTLHELRQLPQVRATFHGDGLTQAMVRGEFKAPANRQSETGLDNVAGVMKPELISAGYRELNARLHRENLAYGVGGGKHAPTVLKLAESIKSTSVLDYGAGKGYLAKALPFPIWEYDPAIPGKDGSPRPADLVVCTDVLEHIEPERLMFVLDDLRRVTRKVGYFVIHTGPSAKKLADGRNAHLIQQGRKFWRRALSEYFELGKIIEKQPLLHVVVGPRTKVRDA